MVLYLYPRSPSRKLFLYHDTPECAQPAQDKYFVIGYATQMDY